MLLSGEFVSNSESVSKMLDSEITLLPFFVPGMLFAYTHRNDIPDSDLGI
jgi:hypothetical protein